MTDSKASDVIGFCHRRFELLGIMPKLVWCAAMTQTILASMLTGASASAYPARKLPCLSFQLLHIRSLVQHQQAPQILIAAFADAQQVAPAARAVLAEHQA